MSRIGKKIIQIPNGVTVNINNSTVSVKGPKGELTQEIHGDITVEVKDGVVVLGAKDPKLASHFWGLYRALIANMVKGVTEGFKKELEIIGVGYRASKSGENLVLNIGFSHPVVFTPQKGITIDVTENTKISVSGASKDIVGLTAAKIRAIRKPEPYKGKGIKYSTEVVRRKAGKAATKAA